MIDDNFFLSIQDKAILANIVFGKSHYEGGRKYCRRCEVFFIVVACFVLAAEWH